MASQAVRSLPSKLAFYCCCASVTYASKTALHFYSSDVVIAVDVCMFSNARGILAFLFFIPSHTSTQQR